jgi:hypothetical protein
MHAGQQTLVGICIKVFQGIANDMQVDDSGAAG